MAVTDGTKGAGRRARLLVETAVGLVAVAARLPGVWSQPFWEDEVASARILHEPTFSLMIHRVGQTESTPPFWYSVAWLVHRAGAPLQDERLLSVAFGALLSIAAVRLAQRFVPLSLAAFVGLLTALGGEFVSHGHELRAYELLALLSTAFGLCLVAELETPSRPRELRLVVVVAAGGSTHYFFAFPVVAALLWLWLDPGAARIRRRATVAVFVGSAVALCWLPLMLMQFHGNRFWWIGPFRLRTVAAVPLRLYTDAYSRQPFGLALSLLTLVVVLLGCARLVRRSAESRAVVVLALGPILLSALIWLAGHPIFDFRNLIGVGPFVAIGFASALDKLPARAAVGRVTALAATLLLTTLAVTDRNTIPAYDVMARSLVRAGWTGAEPIAVYGTPALYRTPLEWYLPHQPTLEIAKPRPHACRTIFVIRPNGTVAVMRSTLPPTDGRARAWLLVRPDRHLPCSAPVARVRPTAVALGLGGGAS